jgi:predicted Zn-dependent protease
MNPTSTMDVNGYLEDRLELKHLLGIDPSYLELLRGRAQLFIDGGHTERALIMLEMLEELDRNDPMPSLIAAELLLGEGRSDEAEAKIDAILARTPGEALALVARAELKIAIGELVPAAALLARVIGGDPEGRTAAGRRALAVAARAQRQLELD